MELVGLVTLALRVGESTFTRDELAAEVETEGRSRGADGAGDGEMEVMVNPSLLFFF